MDTKELIATPEYGASDALREVACELEDLYHLLDVVITSPATPDNIRCLLRPINNLLGSVGDRAEKEAEAWLVKARARFPDRDAMQPAANSNG